MSPNDEEQSIAANAQSTETTSLLGTPANFSGVQMLQPDGIINQKSADETLLEHGETTWRNEAIIIITSALPLVVTFALQYSLTVASIFSLGHLGKVELAGVTLGVLSGNVSGLMIYMGLATSLDTLCAQAYGSGKKELVGLYMQRMLVFFAIITIPIALLWFFSAPILMLIVPDKQVALLASRYLRILILGAPACASFECGKRYMQAQGLFSASTYVMAFCAPLNALMNWFFVWKLQWGFDGAPIAVVITYNLLPLGLILYAYFVAGSDCWGGFSTRAFSNWGPMIRLAIPGLIMLEAESCAFEALTFASSHIDVTTLAAQSILHTIIGTTFQIPFPLSVAGSTRIGNLIGAAHLDAARTATKVNLWASVIVGVFNMILLSSLRHKLPYLFNSDPDVVSLVAHALPLCAAFQLFDSVATNCNGVLRGVGRQRVGGYVQLFAYYGIALPISFSTAFKLDWRLLGLWSGVAIGLAVVSLIELIYIRQLNWQRCVDAAAHRNAMG